MNNPKAAQQCDRIEAAYLLRIILLVIEVICIKAGLIQQAKGQPYVHQKPKIESALNNSIFDSFIQIYEKINIFFFHFSIIISGNWYQRIILHFEICFLKNLNMI